MADLVIQPRNVDGTTILDLTGEVDSYTCTAVREYTKDLLEKGDVNFVINLSKVDYIDSTGLASLRDALVDTFKRGGNIRFICPDEQLYKVFAITGLVKVFSLYDSELVALGVGVPYPFFRCALYECDGVNEITDLEELTSVCKICGTRFTFRHKLANHYASIASDPKGIAMPIACFTTPTYENEFIDLDCRTIYASEDYVDSFIYVLTMRGRLDLFSAGMLQRIFRSIPPMQHCLLDLRNIADFTEQGARLTSSLVRNYATPLPLLLSNDPQNKFHKMIASDQNTYANENLAARKSNFSKQGSQHQEQYIETRFWIPENRKVQLQPEP